MHIQSHPSTGNRRAENTWFFSKPELIALLTYASKDETRENLCGLALDPEHRTAFATDGHRMIAATASESVRVEADAGVRLIPRSVVATAIRSARATKRKSDTIAIRPNGTRAEIVIRDPDGAIVSTADVPLGAGTPPPWRQVMPAEREHGTADAASVVGISATYLADVQTLARVLPGDTKGIYLHLPQTPLDPILVVADDSATAYWRCVIMPMRF